MFRFADYDFLCLSAPRLRGLTLTVFIVCAALPLRSVSRPPERNRNNRTRTINQPYTRAALPLRRSAKRDMAISRKGKRNCRTRLNKFSPAQTQSRARIFPKPISRFYTQKKFKKFLKYPLKTLYNFIEIKYNRHIKSLHRIKVMK